MFKNILILLLCISFSNIYGQIGFGKKSNKKIIKSKSSIYTDEKPKDDLEISNSKKILEVYRVKYSKVEMLDGKGWGSEISRFLYFDDRVLVHSKRHENFLVEFFDEFGYIYSDALIKDTLTDQNYLKGWKSIKLNTGNKPLCYNNNNEYILSRSVKLFGDKIERLHKLTAISLNVITPEEYEVIIELIDATWNSSIQSAYINKNDSYEFYNIPEGYYKLKISMGRDLITKSFEDDCELMFKTTPLYQIIDNIEFFIKSKRRAGFSGNEVKDYLIPNYVLKLDEGKVNKISSQIKNQRVNSNFFSKQEFENK